MKKALAILLAFALVGAFAFADVADIAVEGNATLTWGYNLESKAHGFNNEAEWKITIPLMSKQTFGTKGEGDNYAEINIKDAQYMIEGSHDDHPGFGGGDREIDGIEATLHFGPVYMTVHDKPGFKVNNAKLWDPIKADDYDDSEEDTALNFEPGFDGFGTKIGYKTDMFDVGAKVGSLSNYTGTKDDSKYAFGVDLTATPSEMIEVSASFNYATWARTSDPSKDGFMSLGVKAVAKPVTDLEITLAMDAGNDYLDADAKEILAWDALASAKFKFVEAGTYIASVGTPFEGSDKDGKAIMDLAVYAKLTDGDFVENLDAWFTFMAYRLLSDSEIKVLPMAIGAGANYKYAMNDVNYVKPFAELFANNYHFDTTSSVLDDIKKETAKLGMAFNLGVEYGLFTNTTITAKYEAGSTQDNMHIDGPVDVASADDKGKFTLACKVTY